MYTHIHIHICMYISKDTLRRGRRARGAARSPGVRRPLHFSRGPRPPSSPTRRQILRAHVVYTHVHTLYPSTCIPHAAAVHM